MNNRFDWQTESEGWEEAATAPAQQRTLWRRAGFLAAMLLVLMAAGVLAYREVRNRLHETTLRLEGEVRASYHLVQQAIVGGDSELLQSFMSGRDRRWTDSQLALAQTNSTGGYAKFGVRHAHVASEPPNPEVKLSPELEEAEVLAPVTYIVTATNGLSSTFTLASTTVYRLGEDRWLWSPPTEDFWGSRRSRRISPSLRLTYPERDADLILELAEEIAPVLDRLCAKPGSDCPEDLTMTLAFETDPATLLMSLDDRQRWLERGNLILLPAPTLFGEPIDRAGRDALASLYAAAVVEALVADLGGYRCCRNEIFAQAALDWQLRELGLGSPWPLTASDYTRFSDRFASLDWGETIWGWPEERLDQDAKLLAYALVEFILAERPDLTPVDLLRDLNIATFDERLASVLPVSDAKLPRDFLWQAFLTRRANRALPPLPVPLPDQQLVALCQVESQQHELFRLAPVTGRWSSGGALLGRNIEFVVPLAGGQVLIAHSNQAAGPPQLSLFDGDTLRHRGTLSEAPAGFYTIMGLDPSGNRALLLVQPQDSEALQYYLLDADQCDQGGCNLERFPGHVTWSPDGSHTLIMIAPGGEVWPFINERRWPQIRVSLGDENGVPQQTLAEQALYGLWLDDNTYALLQSEGNGLVGDSQLVIADTPTEAYAHRQGEWLASVSLLDLVQGLSLDAPTELSELMVFPVAANHAGEQELLMMLFDPAAGYADILLYDWRQDKVQQLGLQNPAWPPGFSPEGRWLIVHEFDPSAQTGGSFIMSFVELESGEYHSYPGHSFPFGFPASQTVNWSDGERARDGRWLLYGDGQSLYLLLPEREYQLPILMGAEQCSHAFWLQP